MDFDNISLELKTAIDSIKIGAQIALSYYNQKIEINLKEDETIVTAADKEVELAIKEHISSVFPNSKFVGEETGGSINENEFWIIDPIDGTRSFVRGIPTWCVMVAYCKNKEIIAGACYFPAFKSLIYAQKGKGAYRDGERIHVSDVNTLNKSCVGLSHLKGFDKTQNALDLMLKSWYVRIFGNYTMYLTACGNMEVFVDPYLKIWDLAPWKVIIEEAGGKITRIDGSPWSIEGVGGIVSNGHIHDEVLDIVNK